MGSREKRLLLLSLSIALFLLPIILGLMKLHDARAIAWAERKTKERMHDIQLGVERYCVDSEGRYPESTSVLIKDGYLVQLPTNPFTEMNLFFGPYLGPPRPMREVKLPAVFPGDFLYLKERGNEDGTGDIDGYSLTSFGWSAYGQMVRLQDIPASYFKDRMTSQENEALVQKLFGRD